VESARVGAYLVLVLVDLIAAAMPAYAVSPNLVISQVYGGGGNTAMRSRMRGISTDNGTFETSGQSVTFSAGTLDGPSSHNVSVRATDSGASFGTDPTTVTIENVAPSATLTAPASSVAGFPFTLSLTGATDPSAADTTPASSSHSTAATAAAIRRSPRPVPGCARLRTPAREKSTHCLVRSYTSDQQLADQLCQRLEQAQNAAPSGNAKDSHLARFRDRVDKSGAFTATQAEMLKHRSTEL
jgi:hypothetical protein